MAVEQLSYAQEHFIHALHLSGAYQEGPAKYKLHEKYPNLRLAADKIQMRKPYVSDQMYPVLCQAFAWAMEERLAREPGMLDKVDGLVGVPDAGNPLASALARNLQLRTGRNFPVIRLGKETLDNGERRVTDEVTGEYKAGQLFLPIDDLASSGASLIETVRALKSTSRKHGPIRAPKVAFGIDRELFGVEQLERQGLEVISFLTITQFYNYSVERGFITPETRDNGLAFNQEVRNYVSAEQ